MERSDVGEVERLSVVVALTLFIILSLVSLIAPTELWPFCSYPMFTYRQSRQLNSIRLVGVSDGQSRILSNRDFHAFDHPPTSSRLRIGLERLLERGDRQGILEVLKFLRVHSKVPLDRIRLERCRWTVRNDATNAGDPERFTLVEVE